MADEFPDTHLEIAQTEIALSEQRIVKLKELIAEAKASGEPTARLEDDLTEEVIAQLNRRTALRRLEDGTRH
jgi:hypothetical protein